MSTPRHNPFPSPTGLERVLLTELVKCARLCYEHGWSHGRAGNFSLRGKDGLIWQSPAGTHKSELNPQLFIPISIDSMRPVGPAAARPSNETAIHVGIYRAVKTALCVVHTHPPYLVAASRGGSDLVFQGEEMQKHLGCRDHHEAVRLPVLPNPRPEDMLALAGSLVGEINPKVNLVVLAGHGVYAWADSPLEALSIVETAEFLCRTRTIG